MHFPLPSYDTFIQGETSAGTREFRLGTQWWSQHAIQSSRQLSICHFYEDQQWLPLSCSDVVPGRGFCIPPNCTLFSAKATFPLGGAVSDLEGPQQTLIVCQSSCWGSHGKLARALGSSNLLPLPCSWK